MRRLSAGFAVGAARTGEFDMASTPHPATTFPPAMSVPVAASRMTFGAATAFIDLHLAEVARGTPRPPEFACCAASGERSG